MGVFQIWRLEERRSLDTVLTMKPPRRVSWMDLQEQEQAAHAESSQRDPTGHHPNHHPSSGSHVHLECMRSSGYLSRHDI